jgi:hypothetical protein
MHYIENEKSSIIKETKLTERLILIVGSIDSMKMLRNQLEERPAHSFGVEIRLKARS